MHLPWRLFLSLLAFSLASEARQHTVSLRPLRVYSQDKLTASAAVGNLAIYFNVSLHNAFEEDCDDLVSTAQKEQSHGASLIILKDSNGVNCDLKTPWKDAIILNLGSGKEGNLNGFSALAPPVVSSDGAKDVVWEEYAKKLATDPSLSSASLYESFVPTTPLLTTTTRPNQEEKNKFEVLVPIWVLVVLSVVIVLLIAAGGVGFWWFRRSAKKASEKKAEEGSAKKEDKKQDKIPEPVKKSENSEASKKEKSEKSEKSQTRKSSKEGKSEKTDKSVSEKEGKSEKSNAKDNKQRSPPKSTESVQDNPLRSDTINAVSSRELPPPPERSESSKRVEPVTSTEFEYYLSKISKIVVDYYDDPSYLNVTTNEKPGFLYKKFPCTAPDRPEAFNKLLEFFHNAILPGMAHWQHPRFFAYYVSGRSYPDMLADLLISGLGVVGFSWDSCPAVTEMEEAMVNWLGRALGIPETHLFQDDPSTSIGGGAFYESASEAVFCSMLAARQWKISQLMGKEAGKVLAEKVTYDLDGIHDQCRKLVFYTSKDAHSAMEKGCKMAMVRCRPIQSTAESNWGITGEQLEKEILKDVERGLVPTYIYVTIGTTSTAANDNLESILPVAEKYNMYVHVDAAYAGMFWLDPKFRVKGIERVNSINTNMHKALLHTANSSVFFCKDKKLHMDAFAITPIFLKAAHKNAIDYRDWGVNLSRRFKGIKTWFVLCLYGLDGLRDYLQRLMDNTQYFMELVRKHPNCRIFGTRNYALFCFQYVEPGMAEQEINESTTALCRYMNETNKAFFTHTRVGNHNLIRVSVGYERATKTTYDEVWSLLQDMIEEFKQNRANIIRDQQTPGSPIPGRKRVPMPGDEDISLVGSVNLNTDTTRRSMTSAAITPLPNTAGKK